MTRLINTTVGMLVGVLIGQLVCLAAGEPEAMMPYVLVCGIYGALVMLLLTGSVCRKRGSVWRRRNGGK